MRLKIGILLLFITFNCYAHKDKVLGEIYGNVKVYLRTGFENSEFDKIKIIGKLSEKISQRLRYKDTIFIEYVQDYTDQYSDDLYILEYGNSNYKIFSGIKSEYKIESNNKGLSVRIYADRINIVDILRLVEFTISNKKNTNKYLDEKSIGYNVHEDKVLLEPLITISTDDKLIEKILSSESQIINDVISKKVLISGQELYGMELYWKDDKFIFAYNHIQSKKREIVFEIKDFFHHNIINSNDAIIFTSKFEFYYLDGTKVNERRKLDLDIPIYVPIIVKSYGNKLLLANSWNPSSINIYLIDKNKVISTFD